MGVDVDDSHLYIIPLCFWVFVFSNFECVIEASFPVSFTFCILSFIVITLYRPIVFIIYYRIERNTHTGELGRPTFTCSCTHTDRPLCNRTVSDDCLVFIFYLSFQFEKRIFKT